MVCGRTHGRELRVMLETALLSVFEKETLWNTNTSVSGVLFVLHESCLFWEAAFFFV